MDVVPATISLATGVAPVHQSFSSNTSTWLVLGMSVMAVIYLMMRPKKRDPLSDNSTFRPSLAAQKALERDMQSVIVELSEMSRQMSAQLETRSAKLELLIREADEKIQELRDAALARRPDAATDVADAMSLAAAGAAPGTQRLNLRLVKDSVPPPPTEDRWAEIYRLADSGQSAPQIAQQLRRPSGEIELILALRPKSNPDGLPEVRTIPNISIG